MPNGGVATLTRPAPRERTEQRDLTARDLPVLRREHRFGLGEGPFGIEPFERIRRAFLPLRAHDPRRAFGLVARRAQRLPLFERARIGGERRLGLLERAQHNAVEFGERRLRIGLGSSNTGTRGPLLGESPSTQRSDPPAQRAAPAPITNPTSRRP